MGRKKKIKIRVLEPKMKIIESQKKVISPRKEASKKEYPDFKKQKSSLKLDDLLSSKAVKQDSPDEINITRTEETPSEGIVYSARNSQNEESRQRMSYDTNRESTNSSNSYSVNSGNENKGTQTRTFTGKSSSDLLYDSGRQEENEGKAKDPTTLSSESSGSVRDQYGHDIFKKKKVS